MGQLRIEQLRAAGRKGGRVSATRSRERALKRYYTDPAICKCCGEIIEVEDNKGASDTKKKKFCSHSCSAIYNNLRRESRIILTTCMYCGQETTNPKFCNPVCADNARRKKRWDRMDKQESFTYHSGTIKRYLINKRGHRCEICGLSRWKGLPIPLILDHIDGHSENNNRKNLRLVCPNCDAQLPTYKSKNKGKGRHSRRQRYHNGKSY